MAIRLPSVLLLGLGVCAPSRAQTSKSAPNSILRTIDRLAAPVLGGAERFGYRLRAWTGDRRAKLALDLRFARRGPESFALAVESRWVRAALLRTKDRTRLVLPDAGLVFEATGSLADVSDRLTPKGFLLRLCPALLPFLALGPKPAGEALAELAGGTGALRARPPRAPGLIWMPRKETLPGIERVELDVLDEADVTVPTEGLTVERVSRVELEKMTLRALRRLVSIRFPALYGIVPPRARRVEHGELRRVGEQSLVLLEGSPAEIGRAHGELLRAQVARLVDSTLWLVGLVETVRTGKWFPATLTEAWRRLSPHIPDDHIAELDALAEAVPEVSLREMRLASVFPEYFHCSGFALFGKATKTGELYHGRVLDYMTVIGLQQAAVSFVTRPEGKRAFFSAGYAGFTGVVSGMNDQKLSLGEMGGKGRGAWDGVPMATLMRRALEECTTLDDAKRLFAESPRTCEYYYVFADGKTKDAVAVAATPEKIEFLGPGESHPRLGEGIEDVVFISGGRRLGILRERIRDRWGSFDEGSALRLMDRPVAMSSNLHNVLFVPERGVAWVANATDGDPASGRPYERFSLAALLLGDRGLPAEVRALRATDTLRVGAGASEGARAMLGALAWEPAPFTLRVEEKTNADFDALLTFPSPQPSGDAHNDRVFLEWHRAERKGKRVARAPAMLLLHILDGKMRVAKAFAQGLSRKGVHCFVMHLPGYGRRAGPRRETDPKKLLARFRQGVADARRARDAIAALPGIAQGRIGIQGTSLGGFVTALAGALDGETPGEVRSGFDRVFVVLAGGGLYETLTKGDRDSARLLAALLRSGLGREELQALLAGIEPLTLAPRLDPARTWIFSATHDRVIPAANARKLARAAGLHRSHHRWVIGDHYTAALYLPWIVDQIARKLHAPASFRD